MVVVRGASRGHEGGNCRDRRENDKNDNNTTRRARRAARAAQAHSTAPNERLHRSPNSLTPNFQQSDRRPVRNSWRAHLRDREHGWRVVLDDAVVVHKLLERARLDHDAPVVV